MDAYVNLRDRKQWNKFILDRLVVFDQICQEHGIPWFLEGGSSLGAIRHRGFIPWDNDIDVSLLEEDYKRLRDVYLAGEFPEHYLLQDNDINPHYHSDFPRFIDESSTALLRATEFGDTPSGVQFDVFRLVPVPDDEAEREAAIVRFCVLGEIMHPFKRRCGSRPKEFWAEYHQALREIEIEGRDAVLKRRKQEFFSSDNTSSEWVLLTSSGVYNGYPLKRRSWYQQPATRVFFEGHKFPIPSTPYQVLRQFYGESFRHFPRPSETWKSYRANGNVPARVIKGDYLQLFNYDELISDLTRAKEEQMKLTELRYAYSTPVYQLKAQMALLKMRDELDKVSRDVEDDVWTALRSAPLRDRKLASKVFGASDTPRYKAISHFISTVLDRKYRYWNMTVPLKRDERIICVGFLLLSQRPYWEARRLLALTEGDAVSPNERIQAIADTLQDVDDLLLAMDEKRFLDVDKILSRAEDSFPGIREIAQARMWLAARAQEKVPGCENRQLTGWQAALMARKFRHNGDVLTYYGDYLWARGKKKMARKLYERVKGKTSNGVVLLHIEDCLAGDRDD